MNKLTADESCEYGPFNLSTICERRYNLIVRINEASGEFYSLNLDSYKFSSDSYCYTRPMYAYYTQYRFWFKTTIMRISRCLENWLSENIYSVCRLHQKNIIAPENALSRRNTHSYILMSTRLSSLDSASFKLLSKNAHYYDLLPSAFAAV